MIIELDDYYAKQILNFYEKANKTNDTLGKEMKLYYHLDNDILNNEDWWIKHPSSFADLYRHSLDLYDLYDAIKKGVK